MRYNKPEQTPWKAHLPEIRFSHTEEGKCLFFSRTKAPIKGTANQNELHAVLTDASTPESRHFY